MSVGFIKQSSASVPIPPSGEMNTFVDAADDHFKRKNSSGVVVDIEGAAGGVASFEGRFGAVVSTAGDYTASEITNVPAGDISALNVQAAINELDAEKVPMSHVGSGGAQHAVATTISAGFMSPTDKTKLDGISAGATSYTDEQAQDAVGGILINTANINLTYVDATPTISADLTNTGVIAGTYGSTSQTVQLTIDAKGRISSALNQTITPGAIGAQPLDSTLTALAAFNTNGLMVQIAADTFTARTLTSGSGVTVTNGDGIAGNPTFALNIDGLTLETQRLADADEYAIYDVSQAANRKVTQASIIAQKSALIDTAFSRGSDFIIDPLDGLTATGAGAGNSTQNGIFGIDTVEHALGVSQSDTGTTATGRRAVITDTTALATSIARMRFGCRLVPELLSTGTETFTLYTGFIDNSGAGDQVDGAYFRYTDAVNGGRWEAVTSNTSVRTATDTGVAATITYSIFEVEFNEAGTQAEFYINGTLVATNTTNIPDITRAFGYGWKIEKSVGTTQRNLSVDWYYYEQQRSSAR